MTAGSRTVCVVGSGGREHALAVMLARSADVVVTPGNAGIGGRSPEGHTMTATTAPAEEVEADLYVVGPEAPLVRGLADRLRARGRLVVGPGADGARLEGSKAFMKDLCREAGVPTARYATCATVEEAVAFLRRLDGPYVVKTDGLAAGKGVLVTGDLAEAEADVEAKLSGSAFGEAGRRVVIEEWLPGSEISLLVLCDGERAEPLAPAQDFKRLYDGDAGPNTGGMGAFSPVPFTAGADPVGEAMERIVLPTVHALRGAGIDYRGVLYAGLMITPEGPKLVEYNVRFGDPEAQVVLPRLATDCADLLASVASGSLREVPAFVSEAAVCVVCAAPRYPEAPRTGDTIEGLAEAGTVAGVTIFHAGTARAGDEVRTAGGRVLGVTGTGPTLASARARAYEAVRRVHFPGMQLRSDIALDAARMAGAHPL
jgi:phosphoribosylamine--glycine ligase